MCSDSWLSLIAIIMPSDFVFWTQYYIGKLMESLFFCWSCHWICTLRWAEYQMFSKVVFSNQFSEFFPAQLWSKNCTLSDVKLHLCIVLVEKVKKFFSIAPETAMKTRNVDWPLSLCGYGGPPFVAIQFFPRYLRLLLITCFLLCFSLCLFSSGFQVFSVIPLCI